MQRRKILQEIIVSLLIVLYIYTAVSKFIDFQGFRFDLNNQPFPNEFTPILIWVIPLCELAIALMILFGRTRLVGFCGSTSLMTLFTIYTLLVLAHVFKYVPCSCGGVIKYLTWPEHLIFNLFFLALSIAGIRLRNEELKQLRSQQI